MIIRSSSFKPFETTLVSGSLLFRKWFSYTLHPAARGADVGPERVKNPNSSKKPSRQEKIDTINMAMQSKLYKIDSECNVFNDKVKKVIDLGYVPGNWMLYAKFRMCQIHKLEEEEFKDKCHILGFDLLFSTPPLGVSTIQGNIFSRMAHKNIVNHFKEIALREHHLKLRMKVQENDEFQNSYYVKEQNDVVLEAEIEELSKSLNSLSLAHRSTQEVEEEQNKREKLLEGLEYRADLILSDLSRPFMQQGGFFNHTQSRPYLRFNVNPGLNNPLLDPLKSSIDMSDATLLLSCNALRPDGTLVLRLSKADPNDIQIELLESRLSEVFNKVKTWTAAGSNEVSKHQELVYVCSGKKNDSEYDINNIFHFKL